MSDLFRGWREHSQEKRRDNREKSARILASRGIPFQSKNGGAHLIVSYGGRVADFWPGTGRFIFRDGRQGRGVFKLIDMLGAQR